MTAADEARVEEFAGSLFGACLATMELANVEWVFGSAAELAGRAGIAPRYAREWLEQQAVAGVVAGTVLVVDERTEEFNHRAYQRDGTLLLLVQHPALPRGQHENGGVGTGTVIRPETMQRYATDAGFTTIETLDVEHPQFVLYRLT